jgi:hypothetical protein
MEWNGMEWSGMEWTWMIIKPSSTLFWVRVQARITRNQTVDR